MLEGTGLTLARGDHSHHQNVDLVPGVEILPLKTEIWHLSRPTGMPAVDSRSEAATTKVDYNHKTREETGSTRIRGLWNNPTSHHRFQGSAKADHHRKT
jgi:hypothetical protein